MARPHGGHEVGGQELAGGQVHAHLPARRRVGGEPHAELRAGPLEHELPEGDDEPGVLGDRDELGGGDGPALGVGPAGQRLEGHELARVEADDRLVGDRDLGPLDGPLQLPADGEAIDGAVVHGRLEHLDAALAVGLGRVHGEVGVAQQLLRRRGGPAAGGDADAGAGVDLPAVDHDRRVEGVEDALGHLDDGSGVGGVLEEDGELVAAEASGRVARAEAAPQAVGDGTEQLVAGAVAEAVVHELEVVEVDEGDGGDRRVGRGGCGRARARRGRGTAPGSTGRSARRGTPGGAAGPPACGAR